LPNTTEYKIDLLTTIYKVLNTNISLQLKLTFENIRAKCIYQEFKKLMFNNILA